MHVIDLTSFTSNDITNHGKFATGEVVAAIGDRTAEGQTLTDAKPGLVGIARHVHPRRGRRRGRRSHGACGYRGSDEERKDDRRRGFGCIDEVIRRR